MQPFDVNEVLELICSIFNPQAQSKGVSIHSEAVYKKKNKSVHVRIPKLIGDERRFQQVLVNLVKNAIKFTSHGYIHIKACYIGRPDNRLTVQVIDTGKGIDRSESQKLFSKFG